MSPSTDLEFSCYRRLGLSSVLPAVEKLRSEAVLVAGTAKIRLTL